MVVVAGCWCRRVGFVVVKAVAGRLTEAGSPRGCLLKHTAVSESGHYAFVVVLRGLQGLQALA